MKKKIKLIDHFKYLYHCQTENLLLLIVDKLYAEYVCLDIFDCMYVSMYICVCVCGESHDPN